MKAPPPAVQFVGHPLIAGPIMLAGCPFALLCAIHGSDGLFLALIMAVILNRVMQANSRATEYRTWKRAWDGMDDKPARPKQGMAIARVVVAALAGLFALTHLHDPQIQASIVLIGLALSIWAVVKVCRRFGMGSARRSRSASADRVTVAVRGPLLPVPSLEQAFRLLPDHCQCLRQANDH
jgi:hypothetical protein